MSLLCRFGLHHWEYGYRSGTLFKGNVNLRRCVRCKAWEEIVLGRWFRRVEP